MPGVRPSPLGPWTPVVHRGDHNSILPSRVRLRSAAAVQLHTAAVREGESIPREYDHPWVAYRTLARLTRKGRLRGLGSQSH
jgi:hypothetical protein